MHSRYVLCFDLATLAVFYNGISKLPLSRGNLLLSALSEFRLRQ